jgi:hypothetical protein
MLWRGSAGLPFDVRLQYTRRANFEGVNEMPLRVCSILGTVLLALAVANPAFADKKKKKSEYSAAGAETAQVSAKGKGKKAKKSDDAPKADDASSDSGSDIDKKMESATSGDAKPKPATTGSGLGTADEEPPSDGNSWERPPAEQEKPAAAPPKPVEKPAGSDRPWSAGLLAGWGFKTDRQSGGFGADPYGLGFGIRGGYSLDFHLYVGLFYTYFIGSSETGGAARVNTPTRTTSANYMQFGAEVGYDWWVGPIILRPSLLVGGALGLTNVTTGKVHSVGDMIFGPGFTVVHPWDQFFIGGDGRFLLASGDGVSAVLLAATFGMRF